MKTSFKIVNLVTQNRVNSRRTRNAYIKDRLIQITNELGIYQEPHFDEIRQHYSNEKHQSNVEQYSGYMGFSHEQLKMNPTVCASIEKLWNAIKKCQHKQEIEQNTYISLAAMIYQLLVPSTTRKIAQKTAEVGFF